MYFLGKREIPKKVVTMEYPYTRFLEKNIKFLHYITNLARIYEIQFTEEKASLFSSKSSTPQKKSTAANSTNWRSRKKPTNDMWSILARAQMTSGKH